MLQDSLIIINWRPCAVATSSTSIRLSRSPPNRILHHHLTCIPPPPNCCCCCCCCCWKWRTILNNCDSSAGLAPDLCSWYPQPPLDGAGDAPALLTWRQGSGGEGKEDRIRVNSGKFWLINDQSGIIPQKNPHAKLDGNDRNSITTSTLLN